MTAKSLKTALEAAIEAAEAAGKLMREQRLRTKRVNESSRHDIKLELDVRCQRIITRILSRCFPEIPVLGEEGSDSAVNQAGARWVVDPIDGTVNFAHRIPHAAVSIALQVKETARTAGYPDGFASVVGVVLDPFVGERWTAIRGQAARLNGRPIRVSNRPTAQAIVSIGFSGRAGSIEAMIDDVRTLSSQVRKLRMMGSAALALAYVADGRFDAYLEHGIRLWDIAAGGLLVECAGGRFQREERAPDQTYRLSATSRRFRVPLEQRS